MGMRALTYDGRFIDDFDPVRSRYGLARRVAHDPRRPIRTDIEAAVRAH
jgi:hypothetical protein